MPGCSGGRAHVAAAGRYTAAPCLCRSKIGSAGSQRFPTKLRASRIASTTTLVTAMTAAQPPPAVLLSGSAIGWYGETGEREVDETSPGGSGFLAALARDWEAATRPALLRLPAPLLRAGLGELSSELLASARVLPRNLEKAGYAFWYPDVNTALAAELKSRGG
jgi:NAD dependent epimerase/dehydratase family enzyme